MKPALLPLIAVVTFFAVLCSAQPPATKPEPAKADPDKPAEIAVSDFSATRTYANYYRVNVTPEEMILDFGLNPQPLGAPKDPIVIDQRIIMNVYTAKRLAITLQQSILRHEKVFGPIEIDIQKRIKTPAP